MASFAPGTSGRVPRPLPLSSWSVTINADAGSHRDSSSASGPAIIAAIIPSTTTALVYLAVFVIIRPWYRKIYTPRTFIETIPKKDRTPDATQSRFAFFKRHFLRLGDTFVLQHSSVDAYLFLRFLRLIVLLCFIGTCLTWPILLPANLHGRGNSKQLDRFSFSNINRNDILWSHVTVAWVFFGIVTAIVIRERLRLIGVRQAMSSNETVANKLSSRTVLFLHVPRKILEQADPLVAFGKNAVKVWPVPDAEELTGLIQDRRDVLLQLEAAQVELSQTASKARKRKQRANSYSHDNIETDNLVPRQSRPQHRPGMFKHKVDTIDRVRVEFRDLDKEIVSKQKAHEASALSRSESAVFVAYKTRADAHRACEHVQISTALPVKHSYLDVLPSQVHWHSLTLSSSDRASRASFALVFVVVFIIFFSVPVGLIGSLSNVGYLSQNVRWLSFIKDMPDVLFSLLQGLLPPFLVSWFVSYVPKLLRHVANMSGEPTKTQAELKTQAWFFAFSVIQVFLVTTFSSGAAAVAYKIVKDPTHTPALLAESVPTASNFYMTYFILQGTASAADAVLNYSDLVEYLFYDRFWTRTPRDKYDLFIDMKGIPYGKLYPKFTNLLVIALAYSCIAPLVIGFATVGFVLYYACYRYQFLYVCRSKLDTKGEMYKRALQQMTTGVYLGEICLLGLFGARRGIGQTACMVALLIITALVNAAADRMLLPLESYLGVESWQSKTRAGHNDDSQEAPLLGDDEADHDGERIPMAMDSRPTHPPGPHFLPETISIPLVSFFESVITASGRQITSYLQDPDTDSSDGVAELTDLELKMAYTHPALTAKAPIVWLARDEAGVSRQEIEENEKVGIKSSDEGAWIDDGHSQRVKWSKDDFSRVPIFKAPVRISHI